MGTSTRKKKTKQDIGPAYRRVQEKIRAYPHLKERIYLQLLLHLHEKQYVSLDDIYAQARREVKSFRYSHDQASPNVGPEQWSPDERRLIRRLTLEAACKYISEKKIDEIIISFDGTDQKTYEKYRVGGKFNQVIRGIEKLVRYKKDQKIRRPLINLQFLVLKHNEAQIEQVQLTAKRLGADLITLKSAQVYSDSQGQEYLPDNEKFRRYVYNGKAYRIKSQFPNWDPGERVKQWAAERAKDKGMQYAEAFRVITLEDDETWEKLRHTQNHVG